MTLGPKPRSPQETVSPYQFTGFTFGFRLTDSKHVICCFIGLRAPSKSAVVIDEIFETPRLAGHGALGVSHQAPPRFVWIIGEGTRRFRQQVLILRKCVYRGHGIGKRSSRSCSLCEIEIYLFMLTTCLKTTRLFSSSRREFGSWNNALRAAGITKQAPKKLHKSRLGTLRSLRDVVETRSRAAIPAVLRSQAVYYFGSL